MGRKAQAPKNSAVENGNIRIGPRCVSRVEVNIENDFEVSISESKKQVKPVQFPPLGVRFCHRCDSANFRDATVQVRPTGFRITGTGHQLPDPGRVRITLLLQRFFKVRDRAVIPPLHEIHYPISHLAPPLPSSDAISSAASASLVRPIA